MQRITAGALLAASFFIACSVAEAQGFATTSVDGAVGLGASASLGGTSGVHVRFFPTPTFGLQATLGMSVSNTSEEIGGIDADVSQLGMDMSVYGQLRFLTFDRVALSGIAGIDLGIDSRSVGDADGETDLDFGLGVGFQAEFFPTQFISLFAGGGLALALLDENDTARFGGIPATDASGFAASLGANLWGASGFTVWFN